MAGKSFMANNNTKIYLVDTRDTIESYLLASEELLLKSRPEDGIMVSVLCRAIVTACRHLCNICEIDIHSISPETSRRWYFVLIANNCLQDGAYKMLPMYMYDYKDIVNSRDSYLKWWRSRLKADTLPE